MMELVEHYSAEILYRIPEIFKVIVNLKSVAFSSSSIKYQCCTRVIILHDRHLIVNFYIIGKLTVVIFGSTYKVDIKILQYMIVQCNTKNT